jgi:hypothetical protein
MVAITCSTCAKKQATKATPKGKPRVPRGWKEHQGQAYCSDCWQARYRLRAITFPVAEVLDATWQEFTQALAAAWGQSTRLANWAVNELAKADITRSAGDEKLAAMPAINLYQRWQDHYERGAWTGAAQSANAILRSVELKYRKRRLDVIWRSSAVLPRARYPQPYPVHCTAYEPAYQEYEGRDGHKSRVPVVSVPLAGWRWLVRLRGGNERRRQLANFAQIVRGDAIRGELAIYRVRASTGNHRSSMADRTPGGGAHVSYRIMVKIVAWLPRQPEFISPYSTIKISPNGQRKQLLVSTGNNALLVALSPDHERPWFLHANHVRRWIKMHRWHLDRIANDMKLERRRPRREMIALQNRLDTLTHRQHCRIDTFCHTAARQLANYAARQGVAEVIYSDAKQGYFTEFPYYRLRQLLQEKLDEYGIELHIAQEETASAVVVEEDTSAKNATTDSSDDS